MAAEDLGVVGLALEGVILYDGIVVQRGVLL